MRHVVRSTWAWAAASVLVATLGWPAGLLGQDSPVAEIGERVRVTTRAGADHVGLLTASTAEGIRLTEQSASAPVMIPASTIQRLEVSTERRSRTGEGALIGLGAGVLSGFAICSMGDTCTLLSTDDIKTDVILLSGAVGGVLGLLIGSRIRTEVWEEVTGLHGVAPSLRVGDGLLFSIRVPAGR